MYNWVCSLGPYRCCRLSLVLNLIILQDLRTKTELLKTLALGSFFSPGVRCEDACWVDWTCCVFCGWMGRWKVSIYNLGREGDYQMRAVGSAAQIMGGSLHLTRQGTACFCC